MASLHATVRTLVPEHCRIGALVVMDALFVELDPILYAGWWTV